MEPENLNKKKPATGVWSKIKLKYHRLGAAMNPVSSAITIVLFIVAYFSWPIFGDQCSSESVKKERNIEIDNYYEAKPKPIVIQSDKRIYGATSDDIQFLGSVNESSKKYPAFKLEKQQDLSDEFEGKTMISNISTFDVGDEELLLVSIVSQRSDGTLFNRTFSLEKGRDKKYLFRGPSNNVNFRNAYDLGEQFFLVSEYEREKNILSLQWIKLSLNDERWEIKKGGQIFYEKVEKGSVLYEDKRILAQEKDNVIYVIFPSEHEVRKYAFSPMASEYEEGTSLTKLQLSGFESTLKTAQGTPKSDILGFFFNGAYFYVAYRKDYRNNKELTISRCSVEGVSLACETISGKEIQSISVAGIKDNEFSLYKISKTDGLVRHELVSYSFRD